MKLKPTQKNHKKTSMRNDDNKNNGSKSTLIILTAILVLSASTSQKTAKKEAEAIKKSYPLVNANIRKIERQIKNLNKLELISFKKTSNLSNLGISGQKRLKNGKETKTGYQAVISFKIEKTS